MIYGGGWPEIKMAKAVEELAARTPGVCVFPGHIMPDLLSACILFANPDAANRNIAGCWQFLEAYMHLRMHLSHDCSAYMNKQSSWWPALGTDLDTANGAGAGKKSLAMSAYARALRALPATICDNAGLDR